MKLLDKLDEIDLVRGLGSSMQCYSVMYSVASAFNVKSVVEIGTHRGLSAITFCWAMRDNGYTPQLTSVDSWEQADMRSRAHDNMVKAGVSEFVTMVAGDSKVEIPNLFKRIGKVDLIFIDGNHAQDAVVADYQNCREFSDLILFHDTSYHVEALCVAALDGFNIVKFPTKYVEGDGHPVGITLAHR